MAESLTSCNMCELIKTQENDSPACTIKNEWNTFVESFLSIYVEKVLFDTATNLPSCIKDNGHMLDIINELKNSNLPTNSVLVSK